MKESVVRPLEGANHLPELAVREGPILMFHRLANARNKNRRISSIHAGSIEGVAEPASSRQALGNQEVSLDFHQRAIQLFRVCQSASAVFRAIESLVNASRRFRELFRRPERI